MSFENSINLFDAENNYWVKLLGFFIGIVQGIITIFI